MQRPSLRDDEQGSPGRVCTPALTEPGPLYPSHYNVIEYGAHSDPAYVTAPAELDVQQDGAQQVQDEVQEDQSSPLIIQHLDLCVDDNRVNHHTADYEITEERTTGETPQLIVRRGQAFEVKVKLNRPYDKTKDKIQIQLQIGDVPKVSKGTDQRLPVRNRLELRKWSSAVTSQDDDVLSVYVQASPRAIVGRWRLYIETSVRTKTRRPEEDLEDEVPTVRRYIHGEDVFILFNPWCKEDEVFLQDDSWRDEAVLNENGRIYTGNHRQVSGRPWNYGQFEASILEAALTLLDKAQLQLTVRYDPVRVVRAIAAVVTGCGGAEGGVLVAGWSGKYKDGTQPVCWNGSVSIIEQHLHTNKPIKYGQCWVFSGVCTTLCRTLGIPARTVTNFASAHDCDGAVTMDSHWRHDGTPLDDQNDDYVWCFHSWNEAWMARSDLPAGYGGWQAFDATPQETSEGARQAGPCPVAGIKEGFVSLPSDGAMFFAEVNADKLHWVLQEDATWRMVMDKARVGRKICTKQPRNRKLVKSHSRRTAEDPERLDITQQYKAKEGSEQERTAIYKANLASTTTGHQPNPYDDVRFDFDLPGDVVVGNNFELRLKMQNQSRYLRTANVTFYFLTSHYTGVKKKLIKRQTYDIDIGPIKTRECVLRVSHEEYLSHIVDHINFKVKAMVTIMETGQIFASEDDFRLRRPDLNLQAPTRCGAQEEVTVTVKLVNPLPVHLTKCTWLLEGAGIERTRTITHSDVDPYDTTEAKLTLRPRRAGRRELLVSFTSKELSDVTSSTFIDVQEV